MDRKPEQSHVMEGEENLSPTSGQGDNTRRRMEQFVRETFREFDEKLREEMERTRPKESEWIVSRVVSSSRRVAEKHSIRLWDWHPKLRKWISHEYWQRFEGEVGGPLVFYMDYHEEPDDPAVCPHSYEGSSSEPKEGSIHDP